MPTYKITGGGTSDIHPVSRAFALQQLVASEGRNVEQLKAKLVVAENVAPRAKQIMDAYQHAETPGARNEASQRWSSLISQVESRGGVNPNRVSGYNPESMMRYASVAIPEAEANLKKYQAQLVNAQADVAALRQAK